MSGAGPEQFDVQPNLITQWKQQAMEYMASAFDKDTAGEIVGGTQ